VAKVITYRVEVTRKPDNRGPPSKIRMAEEWGKQSFAARRYNEETTRGSAFAYTNSNNTKGTVLSLHLGVIQWSIQFKECL